MSEILVQRPGLLTAFYPEREDERLGTLDRVMASAVGRVSQFFSVKSAAGAGFLRRVAKEEKTLAKLEAHAFNAARVEVAQMLRVKGLRADLVARAFALVRIQSERSLQMRPFDVQLLGGRAMLRGRIAEMDTGEGKTLTATLPAAIMALSGVPVHIVTVNDFLAARDAEWMGPLYRALGLSVGVIIEGLSPEERQAAYACDICYCTNKQLAFDYLKDRLVLEGETRALHMALEGLSKTDPKRQRLLMRGLCYAIVDEADSVLVDEARTPLIITRAGDHSGLEQTYQRAVEIGRKLTRPRDFTVREKEWKVELTDLGKARLRQLSAHFGGVWATEIHREELARQALSALHLYHRDKHYIVDEAGVQIVDEYTGRVMSDRSWERGLHQMIEVKEGCEITGRQETLIRISYQRFFRRYLTLAGMTGTAAEVSGELRAVYRLRTKRIPTNRRSRRKNLGERHYATADQKWRAVLAEAKRVHMTGRPILIGTQSIAASEEISALLTEEGLTHRVLNARETEHEAHIIAEAGGHGRITVATNMAGRGTDIRIDQQMSALGGLHVIATGRHDARRIDRQLFGRCGRQGDPGSFITFVSLEDDLLRVFYGTRLSSLIRTFSGGKGRVPWLIGAPVTRLAQRATEARHSGVRKALLRADDNLEDLLAFSGRGN
ncbi:prepilin peptidase [Thioclava sp. NG1]|uniref:preprotein translocase subunit SecA n=1 Tax=Thioclava sp. NG1 TaxID=2182426 RepID=UPI000D60895E|nr:preprotein translocase subunit SecA [Thioclava sp. NG1]PWE51304.1 prepilin peptidase [Thioclava sp. NG1]